MEHFDVKLINKGKAFYLTRDEFALVDTKPSLPYFSSLAAENAYVDEIGSAYTENWCSEYRKLCLKNYDLNMIYFSLLDRGTFENILNEYLDEYKQFKEINDLNEVAKVEGYYIMVLDEYKQVYIGKTDDIKKRIMRHWSHTLPFDRTLFPMYAWEKSCFSIDSFRALDTTRVYAWKKKVSESGEKELIKNFSAEFCLNRIGGGVTQLIEAVATMKKRNFL